MSTTYTLSDIKQKQDEINAMIAALESYQGTQINYPATTIDLQAGEHYAGLILGKDGRDDYHLILMDGEAADVDFKAAKKWIKSRNDGADLPSRREQSLLFANLKEQFKEEAYWSNEEHASYAEYAWYQYFCYGTQTSLNKIYSLRARAVRRVLVIK